jgi:hypothetical protein
MRRGDREAEGGRRAPARTCVVLVGVYGAGEHHLYNTWVVLAAYGHWARNMGDTTYIWGRMSRKGRSAVGMTGSPTTGGGWIEKTF